MRGYHFTPESYLAMMREAVPGYDRLGGSRSPGFASPSAIARRISDAT
jgi:hypothetical protein